MTAKPSFPPSGLRFLWFLHLAGTCSGLLAATVPRLEFVPGSTTTLRWVASDAVVDLEASERVGGPFEVVPEADGSSTVEGRFRMVQDRRAPGGSRFYRLRLREGSGEAPARLPAYEIGSPVLRDVWVDGTRGNDDDDSTHDGTSRERAFRGLGRAFRSLPAEQPWETGYRIRIVAGEYRGPYLEDRRGTASTPVLIEPADGPGTVIFRPAGGDGGNITFFQCSHVYLQDLRIEVTGGDALQFERCDHVLLRRMKLQSVRSEEQNETLKVNQCQHVYVEDSDIGGAGDNGIDMVGVQYGHIVRNKIHDTQDWGAYLKGGSAYFLVEGNEIYRCGTGGFTAGQGSGFQFMVPPWLHYEAYDVKVINNLIHDTEGAGLGVNGGYNILLAHNTLYRVGTRSHLLEFVYGGRTCDGRDVGRCQPYLEAGGWGQLGDENGYSIPNRNVAVFNNLVFNPPGVRSEYQHFEIRGATPREPGFTGPDPVRADDGLVIRGNVIWNGPSDWPLGIEGSETGACGEGNPTCSGTQLHAENAINTFEPDLPAHATGGFRPQPGGRVTGWAPVPIPDFTWADAPPVPPVPPGRLENVVLRDYLGRARPAMGGAVGALLP